MSPRGSVRQGAARRNAAQQSAAPVLKTLDRVISKAGLGSRTEAAAWIAAGRVRVNGRIVADPGCWVAPGRDRVTLDGKEIRPAERVYLLLHKPEGYVTTRRDPDERPTVFDLLPEPRQYLLAVGRLDLDTSGLLLLTNDSSFADRVADPRYKLPKTYEVKAASHLTEEQLGELRRGVGLKDGPTRPAGVRRLRDPGGKTVFEMTITEGRNRQVRRMVEAVGSSVIRLVRTAIGPLRLGALRPGEARALTSGEVRALARQR